MNPAHRPCCFELLHLIRSTLSEDERSPDHVALHAASDTLFNTLWSCTQVQPVLTIMRWNRHNASISRCGCQCLYRLFHNSKYAHP